MNGSKRKMNTTMVSPPTASEKRVKKNNTTMASPPTASEKRVTRCSQTPPQPPFQNSINYSRDILHNSLLKAARYTTDNLPPVVPPPLKTLHSSSNCDTYEKSSSTASSVTMQQLSNDTMEVMAFDESYLPPLHDVFWYPLKTAMHIRVIGRCDRKSWQFVCSTCYNIKQYNTFDQCMDEHFILRENMNPPTMLCIGCKKNTRVKKPAIGCLICRIVFFLKSKEFHTSPYVRVPPLI